MTRRGWLLVCSSVLCAASAGVAGYAISMRRFRPASRDNLAEEQLLQLINEQRARTKYVSDQGQHVQVPPLRDDDSLQQVALDHARDMGRGQVRSMMEAEVNKELEAAGYSHAFWGQVPGLVSNSLPEAFESWMNDKQTNKSHPRQVLLNPFFEDIGIGVYRAAPSDPYYVYALLAKKK